MAPEIEKAIVEAAHVVVVISPAIVNSDWVSREVKKALQVQRSQPRYRVVPVLLPGMTPKALRLWFKKEPVAVEMGEGPLGLIMAMPKLLAALGVREPTDDEPLATPVAPPVAELVLRLSGPRILAEEGMRRAARRLGNAHRGSSSGSRDTRWSTNRPAARLREGGCRYRPPHRGRRPALRLSASGRGRISLAAPYLRCDRPTRHRTRARVGCATSPQFGSSYGRLAQRPLISTKVELRGRRQNPAATPSSWGSPKGVRPARPDPSGLTSTMTTALTNTGSDAGSRAPGCTTPGTISWRAKIVVMASTDVAASGTTVAG